MPCPTPSDHSNGTVVTAGASPAPGPPQAPPLANARAHPLELGARRACWVSFSLPSCRFCLNEYIRVFTRLLEPRSPHQVVSAHKTLTTLSLNFNPLCLAACEALLPGISDPDDPTKVPGVICARTRAAVAHEKRVEVWRGGGGDRHPRGWALVLHPLHLVARGKPNQAPLRADVILSSAGLLGGPAHHQPHKRLLSVVVDAALAGIPDEVRTGFDAPGCLLHPCPVAGPCMTPFLLLFGLGRRLQVYARLNVTGGGGKKGGKKGKKKK